MESRIKDLIEKYWEGETTLQEEMELKNHFKENPSLLPEGVYFRSLSKTGDKISPKFRHPGKRSPRSWWIAASIAVGIGTAAVVIQDAKQQNQFAIKDPQEAYEITKRALMMVSTSLNEGTAYSKELDKINEAEKILNEIEN